MNRLSQPEFESDRIIIGATGGKPGIQFIIHYKEIPAVEVTVHFFDLLFIDDMRFMNAMELRRQLFLQ